MSISYSAMPVNLETPERCRPGIRIYLPFGSASIAGLNSAFMKLGMRVNGPKMLNSLKESIIADAHEDGRITSSALAERLIHERKWAVAEIERLQEFANSFGLCTCDEGMCDPAHDFQCRAREALTGKSNVRP